MNRGKEGAVQPASTLRYEFGNLDWDVDVSLNCDQINTGVVWLTVLGTSVEALALLTYFKLCHYQQELLVLISRNSHPALAFLCNNFEAKNTILSEVHISLFVKVHRRLSVYLLKDVWWTRTKKACIASSTMHSLTLEIRSKGSFTVGAIQECLVTVSTESSGKNADISKDTLIIKSSSCIHI